MQNGPKYCYNTIRDHQHKKKRNAKDKLTVWKTKVAAVRLGMDTLYSIIQQFKNSN